MKNKILTTSWTVFLLPYPNLNRIYRGNQVLMFDNASNRISYELLESGQTVTAY